MFLGIDVGAGKIRIGRIERGRVLEVYQEKTERKNIPGQIIALINRFDLSNIKAVGVGIAGKIEGGVVISSPNIGIKNLPLYKILKENFNLPFIIENDCNCQTIAEYKYGAGKGAKSLLGIFVGSGIGGGIMINRRLIKGCEIGHMVIDLDGPECGCKRKGCFEALASGIALARYAKEAGFPNGSASYIAKEAKNKNQKADKIIKEMGKLMGIGITNLINILNPERIVLGGGVILQLVEIVEIVEEFIKKEALFSCIIKKGELGDNSGIIGASIMAKDSLIA